MRLALFGTRAYDQEGFERANLETRHDLLFLEPRLTQDTAKLAEGCPAVCSFVNDRLDQATISILHNAGVRLIALRCAGYNHVDLAAATALGLRVTRVPEYSPHAVAEHAVALVLSLNRRIHRAHARVREGNFSLEGLVGFDLHGKTVGILGMGRIGQAAARIFAGFGCKILAADQKPEASLQQEGWLRYVQPEDIFRSADIISLHLPLTPATRHIVSHAALNMMKPSTLLVNTGRGALIDSVALIRALKAHQIGGAALDVYEEEEQMFFQDMSNDGIPDDVLARLLTFPNVLITAHQGFLTHEALQQIAKTTLQSVSAFEQGLPLVHEVVLPPHDTP